MTFRLMATESRDMTQACPGTVAAAFAKAEVPSLSSGPIFAPAPHLQGDGRSTTSKDKLFRMSVDA